MAVFCRMCRNAGRRAMSMERRMNPINRLNPNQQQLFPQVHNSSRFPARRAGVFLLTAGRRSGITITKEDDVMAQTVSITVNGTAYSREVEPRLLLKIGRAHV